MKMAPGSRAIRRARVGEIQGKMRFQAGWPLS